MFARIYSGGVMGIDAFKVEVEVDSCSGLGQFQIVGLPDAAVRESQERVRSAIKASSFLLPPAKKFVVNLAPADTKKEGPQFDLPIAVGILTSTGLLDPANPSEFMFMGELGLDGSVRPVSAVLPIAMFAARNGILRLVVPEDNASEAALVDGLTVYPVSHLSQACAIAADQKNGAPVVIDSSQVFKCSGNQLRCHLDYRDVKGQEQAKRAMEIAAAGRHNVLMVGPPGSGKSMLAERMPSVMPPLEFEEALEITKLHSVAGLLREKGTLVCTRPFRAPHHSSSAAGLTGGGRIPRPGEISLSHLGILFLDELTEFTRSHLDTLRQPLESGTVTLSRAMHTLTYPASFLLVGACNPCPCGYRGDPLKHCSCTPGQANRYWSRLSGPFLDRIDLQVEVARLKENELVSTAGGESSGEIRLRVLRAVEIQKQRFDGEQFVHNGQLSHRQVVEVCKVDESSRQLLARAVTQFGLSARAYDRILRIARTIADLEASVPIECKHVAEAIRYRTMQRSFN